MLAVQEKEPEVLPHIKARLVLSTSDPSIGEVEARGVLGLDGQLIWPIDESWAQ